MLSGLDTPFERKAHVKYFAHRALAVAASFFVSTIGMAQEAAYPTRPIKLVVGYPAGGASDVTARLIAQKLGENMGQPVVVENRPGSASNIGADVVAKAAPDGYTLLLGTISLSVNPSLYSKLTYDPIKDLTAVSLISSTAFLLVTNPKSPYQTVEDLLKVARAKPGDINYATAGNGSGSHLFTELFASSAGIKLNHIPYRGAAPAMTDVLGNRVPITFDNIVTTLPLVKTGKLRALAVSTKQRSRFAPDIPTLAESGVTGFDATAWFGLFAPAGTPPEIIKRLNKEVVSALKEPAVSEKLLQLGAEPAGSTPEAFDAFFKAEVAKWGQVVRSANIHVE